MRLNQLLYPIAFMSLLQPLAISAATSTANLTVKAEVVASCTVQSATLAFNPYILAEVNAQTTITTECTSGTNYTLSLGAGLHGGGTTSRKMKHTVNSSDFLDYSLHSSSAVSTADNWGNVLNTDTVSQDHGVLTGVVRTHTVYGKIPASQTSPIGLYEDTVVITVHFNL